MKLKTLMTPVFVTDTIIFTSSIILLLILLGVAGCRSNLFGTLGFKLQVGITLHTHTTQRLANPQHLTRQTIVSNQGSGQNHPGSRLLPYIGRENPGSGMETREETIGQVIVHFKSSSLSWNAGTENSPRVVGFPWTRTWVRVYINCLAIINGVLIVLSLKRICVILSMNSVLHSLSECQKRERNETEIIYLYPSFFFYSISRLTPVKVFSLM